MNTLVCFPPKCQIVLLNMRKEKMPSYLIKRNHSIIFCKNEQRGVLQTVHIIRILDDACRMGTGTQGMISIHARATENYMGLV